MQISYPSGTAVLYPHRYYTVAKLVVCLPDPVRVFLPQALVEGGQAIPGAADPVGLSVILIGL